MYKVFQSAFWVVACIATATLVTAAQKELPSTCKRCNMHIQQAEKKFSVTISEGIEPSAFNDIGCAISWRYGECAMRTDAFDSYALVFDYKTGEPVAIEKAFFVHNSGLKTPKGYDLAAFRNKEDALALVKETGKGDVLTFSQAGSLKFK